MGGIEWAIWANENAIASAVVTIIGGILALAGGFNMWQIGGYALAIGILSLILEYPRSKRRKGSHNRQRGYQHIIAAGVSKGGLLTRNYFIRFVFYLVASVPCCFILQTLLGALCLMITGFIYLAAGVNGEEWQAIPQEKSQQGPKVIAEPTRPPPRRPDMAAAGSGDQRSRQPEDSRV